MPYALHTTLHYPPTSYIGKNLLDGYIHQQLGCKTAAEELHNDLQRPATACNPQAVPRGAGRWLAAAAALGQDSSLGVDVAAQLTGSKRFALRQARPACRLAGLQLQPAGVEEAWRRRRGEERLEMGSSVIP